MKINIELDDTSVQAAFNRLIKVGRDLAPAMQDIGEHLLGSTRERFNDQQEPDGKPWAPLSEVTVRRKQKNTDKILTERGYLRGTLAYRADRQEVRVGSTRIYAPTHQFGAKKGAFGRTRHGAPIPWGDIPARPFLGVSDADAAEINLAVRDFLKQALN